MRSDLEFKTGASSVPWDRAGVLTEWDAVGTDPSPTAGQLFPAMDFDGSGGFEHDPTPDGYNGITAVSARFVLRPDFLALDGVGRVVLAALGESGPLLSEAVSWGFGLRVTGGSLELLGIYQDLSLVVQEVVIATVAVPSVQTVPHTYGFSREIVKGVGYWRVSLDGVEVGSASAAISVPFVVGVPLTLGCRNNQGVYTEFYDGVMEAATIDQSATTAAQERHEHAVRERSLTERARVRALLPEPINRDPGSVYHDIRVRPLADGFGDLSARILAVDESGIWKPYGTQLDRWLRSLGIEAGTQTLSEIQAAVEATMADRGGFTAERLRQIVADLTGAAVADVDLYETNNELVLPTEATPDVRAAGPWRVEGFGTADLTASGLVLSAIDGRDLQWEPWYDRAVYTYYALDHVDPNILTTPEDFRPWYGLGFRGELVAISGATSAQWAGITLAGRGTTQSPRGEATHIGVYGAGPSYTLAYRHSTLGIASGAVLGSWTALGTIEVGDRLSVSWDDNADGWIAVVEPTAGDPTTAVEYSLSGVPEFVTRVGFSLVSEGVLSGDLSATWTDSHVHYPRLEGAKKYYLISDLATVKDHKNHTNVIRSNERPTTLGHVTYGPELETDSTDTVLDFSPLADTTVAPIALADYRQHAVQNTTRDPSYLWTFQEAASPVRDRRNHDYFTANGANIQFQQPGPDGRYALRINSDGGTDHLVLSDATAGDTGSGADITAVLVYRYDPDAGGDDVVLRKVQNLSTREWRLRIAGQVNFNLFVDDGIATTSTIAVPATVNAWDVVAFRIVNTGGNNYTLNLATRTATATASPSFGTTIATNLPLTIGDASALTLAPALCSYRWLFLASGTESAGLTAGDLQTICQRVYTSIQ